MMATVGSMVFIHWIQILILMTYIDLFVDVPTMNIEKGDLKFYAGGSIVMFLYYLLVFHNGKWKNWFKEFEEESKEKRRKGTIKVLLYTVGSIVFFFISIISLHYLRNIMKLF